MTIALSSCSVSSQMHKAENIAAASIATAILIYVLIAMNFGKSVSP